MALRYMSLASLTSRNFAQLLVSHVDGKELKMSSMEKECLKCSGKPLMQSFIKSIHWIKGY